MLLTESNQNKITYEIEGSLFFTTKEYGGEKCHLLYNLYARKNAINGPDFFFRKMCGNNLEPPNHKRQKKRSIIITFESGNTNKKKLLLMSKKGATNLINERTEEENI